MLVVVREVLERVVEADNIDDVKSLYYDSRTLELDAEDLKSVDFSLYEE